MAWEALYLAYMLVTRMPFLQGHGCLFLAFFTFLLANDPLFCGPANVDPLPNAEETAENRGRRWKNEILLH
jgi:hypothetical protein